ncbi:sugar phosphate isomerase/epimerase family protein [Actinacidiphila sp. ITFR-21]|uniref:sugar phosphate isomerase/epimerase family protein n=1 Tax=Actinacidiphila sp. ITFR-21 TaxID=3075199 RepID=UPI00288C0D48|nr:sugar phosphate isomerase/epimerase family protein [Streptomyces sp. ITFR-21]WNI18736.1 sugar phosphate isomerase/epimerase family protein [Streptomyces sp. ITFR-21]
MKDATKYIVNTYSYTIRGGVEPCLEELSDAGFTAIELMTHPGHGWPSELDSAGRRRLAAALRRTGIEVASISQPNIDLNLTASAPEMREHSLTRLLQLAELGGEIGAPAVQVGPGKISPLLPDPPQEVRGRLFRALDALVEAGRKTGVRVLLENMPVSFLAKCADLRAMIDDYGSDAIGMTYDIANAEFVGDEHAAAIQVCGDLLEMVHISDTGHQEYRHDPVGQGVIDFPAVGAALAASSWAGRPVIEVIGRSANPLAEIVESIERLEAMDWLGRSLPGTNQQEVRG